MFSDRYVESEKPEIRLHGINKTVMDILIYYAKANESEDWNDSRFGVNDENVINILQAAGMLQCESIRKVCCEYILNHTLSVTNALQLFGK